MPGHGASPPQTLLTALSLKCVESCLGPDCTSPSVLLAAHLYTQGGSHDKKTLGS